MSEGIRNFLMFDYDGTLTYGDSTIPQVARKELLRIRRDDLATLGIISGRDLPFLMGVNSGLSNVFSFLVAENGAISYFRDTCETMVLGRSWTEKAREVFGRSPLHMRFAEVICATRIENAELVSKILSENKLEAKLAPNKDSLMVLPPNVDKGTGVATALQHYGETKHIHLTCFGDGENDVALFAPADLGVAVANAVDALKEIADVVTEKAGGLGVAEYLAETFLIDSTLA